MIRSRLNKKKNHYNASKYLPSAKYYKEKLTILDPDTLKLFPQILNLNKLTYFKNRNLKW